MGREEFLSSNLYGMRDRLRRNSARIQAEKEERDTEVEVSSSAPPAAASAAESLPPEPPPSQESAVMASAPEGTAVTTPAAASASAVEVEISLLPTMNIPHEGSAAGRERRELEGNLLRDCAYADELLKRSRNELLATEEFRNALFRQLRELRDFDGQGRSLSEKDYSRQLARMRGEYFYASGKFEAAGKRSEHAKAVNTPHFEAPPLPRRLVFWLLLGLVCNGLIVAAGFFCAWKRW